MAEAKIDASEEQYRKDARWLSFKSAAWGALGMAAFFGALGTLANGLMSVAAGMPAVTASGWITPSAYVLGGAVPYLTIGAIIAVGAFATYMSQKDQTELSIMRDAHNADQQAKCMAAGKAQGLAPEIYEQNCRADGKSWQESVTKPELVVSR